MVWVTFLHDEAVTLGDHGHEEWGQKKEKWLHLFSAFFFCLCVFSLGQREADRNQELLTRIKQYQERETEAENKLKEQMEMNKSYKKNMETMNKKLQEKESKLAEANEVRTVIFNPSIASGDFGVLVTWKCCFWLKMPSNKIYETLCSSPGN